MDKNKQKLLENAAYVEAALEKFIPLTGEPCVCNAIRYSLLGGGKRIRATLVLEFAKMNGVSLQAAIPFACAVEMVHAYSLIHDDLPCMDNDDLRRGKPSCHKKFGEAVALLAGDALLTLAFETIASASLSDAHRIDAVMVLSQAVGCNGMVGGQMLDLQAEKKQIEIEDLQHLYQWKTGALLAASAQLGCIVGDVSTETRTIVDTYMKAIGLLFQITDDILDVTGDQQILGKPIGSDAYQEKKTSVSLLGLERAHALANEQAKLAISKAKEFSDHNFLLWLPEWLLTREN